MKVLWFEVSVPGNCNSTYSTRGSWQDALEDIVRSCEEIELYIAYTGKPGFITKKIDGVTYIPIIPSYSFIEKHLTNKYNRWNVANKLLPLALDVVKEVSPDIIHVFGSEWEYGRIAKFTSIPVVIHMQGCLRPYYNFSYAPGFSEYGDRWLAGLNLKHQIGITFRKKFALTSIEVEEENFKAVRFYMGRTSWDRMLVDMFHPGAEYYLCNEALRPEFINCKKRWTPHNRKTIKLITTGTSGYIKGMDVALKTAQILVEHGVNIEWSIVGGSNHFNRKGFEEEVGLTFESVGIRFVGYKSANELCQLLLDSDIYVHCSYIDNSPNAVCEAQYLGVPVIATCVGGIPSLVKNNENGILVPANHPYHTAYEIMQLIKDIEQQQHISNCAYEIAHKRHNPDAICMDLLYCYRSMMKKRNYQ